MGVDMPMWILLAVGIGIIAVACVGILLSILLRNVRTAQGPTMLGKYPQGHWMSIGICIGIAMGSIPALVGLILDVPSSWVGVAPAIGLGCGIAIGLALERKHKDKVRPLTEQEQRSRTRFTLVGLGVASLLVLSVFVLGAIVLLVPR